MAKKKPKKSLKKKLKRKFQQVQKKCERLKKKIIAQQKTLVKRNAKIQKKFSQNFFSHPKFLTSSSLKMRYRAYRALRRQKLELLTKLGEYKTREACYFPRDMENRTKKAK